MNIYQEDLNIGKNMDWKLQVNKYVLFYIPINIGVKFGH